MLYPFNPSEVQVTLGPIILQGFGTGSIISVAFNGDAVTEVEGSQGDIAWVVNPSRAAKATLQLMQGSVTNDQLSAISAHFGPRRKKLVILPFRVTDLGGTTICVGPQAIVMGTPPAEFAREHRDREWRIAIADLTMHLGGSKSAFPVTP